jgi:hypothetical protein
MMITGDYQHTAIAVARGVGMIAMDCQVVVMEAKSERAHSASVSVPLAQHTALLPKPGSALQHPGGKTGSSSCQHLMFTLDRGGVCEEVDPHTAITTIAQVGCCAMTYHAVLPIHMLPTCVNCVLTRDMCCKSWKTECVSCLSRMSVASITE